MCRGTRMKDGMGSFMTFNVSQGAKDYKHERLSFTPQPKYLKV